MEWRDSGYIIGVRRYGESSVILDVLTKTHGRYGGYVRGGARSKRLSGVMMCGNLVRLYWKARLEEHLGSFQVELEEAFAVKLMDDALLLDGLNALCALVYALPERQAAPIIFTGFADLLSGVCKRADWPAHFARFELALLAELGFGLDEKAKAGLPNFLVDKTIEPHRAELLKGLEITASFLETRIYAPLGKSLPQARQRLAQATRSLG